MQNSSSFFQGQARFSNGFFGIYHSPFGVELKGRNLKKNNAKNYRFGFQGQEGDDQIKGDGNSYTTEFRQYDSRIGRWLTIDPQSGKYPDISSYCAFINNPISIIDVKGDTIARFNSKGVYIGWKDDGKTGWTGLITVKHKNAKTKKITYTYQIFYFADPIQDPKDLQSGKITRLLYVKEDDIKEMLIQAGAFDPKNGGFYDGIKYAKKEGEGPQKLDFSYSGIKQHYPNVQEVSKDPMTTPSSVLFYVPSDGMAHNHMNFGNYLFGAACNALIIPKEIVLIAAHVNSLKNSEKNGYPSQMDSPDDQRSISKGYDHSSKNGYMFISKKSNEKMEKGEKR
jgi:RHS repeat-associated protein